VLGYLTSVALRFGFPESVVERLVALLVAAQGLATAPPKSASLHVAVAGFLAQTEALDTVLAPHWERVSPEERERWERDRVLIQVAGKARATRRERAWETLGRRS
jgi:hypothetical protein